MSVKDAIKGRVEAFDAWARPWARKSKWNGWAYEFLKFGLKQAWACLFGGAMLLDSPEDRKYQLFSVGAQVDLGFTVVMRLPMVLSFGVAHGFGDKDIDGRTELMASLKIL